MTTRARLTRTFCAATGVLFLSGCATTSTPADNPPIQAAPPTSSSAISQPPAGSLGADGPACGIAQLAISVRGVEGGMNHAGSILVFTDHSGPCTMSGYPSLIGLVNNSHAVVQAQQTPSGYLGGVPTGLPRVNLQTGQTASALYEGTGGPVDGATQDCPQFTALLVTPPNTTDSFRIPTTTPPPAGQLCNLQIHPITAGVTGGANTPTPPN